MKTNDKLLVTWNVFTLSMLSTFFLHSHKNKAILGFYSFYHSFPFHRMLFRSSRDKSQSNKILLASIVNWLGNIANSIDSKSQLNQFTNTHIISLGEISLFLDKIHNFLLVTKKRCQNSFQILERISCDILNVPFIPKIFDIRIFSA